MKIRLRFFTLGILLLVIATGLGGCCALNTVKPLKAAKDLADRSDYAALAAIEIRCQASCDGCNQLHLLKGDACYRLAKAGDAPAEHFSCAATELAEGIAQTRTWQMENVDLNRSQTYINLCESLRERRDMLSGADADAANEKLLRHARAFLDGDPQNPCGIYYEANAMFAQLRACLLRPQNCPDLCARLQALQQRVAQGMAAGGGQCAAQLKNLGQDIRDARQIANCP